MADRKLILKREGAARVRISLRNFRRWTIDLNIMPIDISAPGAKKRSLRYYEDEVEAVITAATERSRQAGKAGSILWKMMD
jgi:hypothetical protein